MATTRVAHRYAKALMEIAQEQGSFDTVIDDVQTLRSAIEGSTDLRNLLASPIIDVHTKERILREIFGGKIGTVADRFIALLATKGRAADLAAILRAFQHLLDIERNVVVATITTAVELDVAQRTRIEERIKQMSGHDVRAEYMVDPSLVGGFRARFEDKMIDASVRHQLERLRISLIEGSSN
jgi:F-type H+-transporting ATPase subunit delta